MAMKGTLSKEKERKKLREKIPKDSTGRNN